MRVAVTTSALIFALGVTAQGVEGPAFNSVVSEIDEASASVTAAISSISESATLPPAPTETIDTEASRCLKTCDEGDVKCQADCVHVPRPEDPDVNATNECVADCDQGNGTEADNLAYGECVQGCINTHYGPTTPGKGNNDDSSSTGNGAGSGSGSGNGSTGGSTSNSNSTNGDDNDDNNDDEDNQDGTEPDSAASQLVVSITGVVGLVAAFFAL